MHGLINKAIQSFVVDTCGHAVWDAAVLCAGLDFDSFEVLVVYEDALTQDILDAVSTEVQRPVSDLLEDLGTYLVSHPNLDAVRRLLRFGGVDFVEFLFSLDDLAERARLAVPDLVVPEVILTDEGQGNFLLETSFRLPGVGYVLIGILRAMADDYGALVFMEYEGTRDGLETVRIRLINKRFAEAKQFDLIAPEQAGEEGTAQP